MWKTVRLSLAILFVAEIIWWSSPIREAVGRWHPKLAARLSPPLFNFSGAYRDGGALEFKIGMSRTDLADVLRDSYAKDSVLLGRCGAPAPLKGYLRDIPIDSEAGALALNSRNTLCVFTSAERKVITFSITNDLLSEIDISVIHTGI